MGSGRAGARTLPLLLDDPNLKHRGGARDDSPALYSVSPHVQDSMAYVDDRACRCEEIVTNQTAEWMLQIAEK